MIPWYIDTSVLGAYYCPEPASKMAQNFLLEDVEPVISLLSEVEFSSLVAKKKRIRDFGTGKAKEILLKFQFHIEEGYYQKLILTPEVYYLARDMIGDMGTALRTLDALHIAIAAFNDLPIVTMDAVFSKSAEKLGLKVKLLRS